MSLMTTFLRQLETQQKSLVKAIMTKQGNEPCRVNYLSARYQKNMLVYQNSFYAKLEHILLDCYPATVQFVGVAEFTVCIKNYLRHHTPIHYRIRVVADDFFRFLKVIRYQKKSPIAVDLLLFEKCLAQAHITDHVVMASHYPVGQLWRALIKRNSPVPLLVYRDTLFVYQFSRCEEKVFFNCEPTLVAIRSALSANKLLL